MAATTTTNNNQDDQQVYEELKGFLLSNRADLRRAATEAVQQVATSASADRLVQHDGLIAAICKNISYYDDDLVVAKNALQSLVYLISSPHHGGSLANQCVVDLLEAKATNRVLEVLMTNPPSSSSSTKASETTTTASSAELKELEDWRAVINYAMALLANLTRTEEGAIELVGRTLPDEAVQSADVDVESTTKVKPTMDILIARFLSSSYLQEAKTSGSGMTTSTAAAEENDYDWESSGLDPYQHFAGVLQNATQVEKGRQFLLRHHYTTDKEDSTTLLQDLLPQLRSPNPIRRRGIAGVVRNICLDKDSSWWLLNVVQITPHLLYPLAGPEELEVDEKKGLHPDLWLQGPDKVREPDHWTRLFLVESILVLLSTGRLSREKLRLDRVYIILKWADMVEEHEDVSELINECVQYLRRDENGTEEGSSDRFVADFYAKPSHAVGGGRKDDGDDDDFDAID